MPEKKTEKKLSLMQKLAEIHKAVGYLKKKNKNDFQKFMYVSSSQVLMAVREQMAELGVLLTPRVTAHNMIHFPNQKGQEQLITELDIEFTWCNVDDPEDKIVVPWYAQGKDSDEKGVGKALTYGEKFFILKQFQIATDKHDPDALPPSNQQGGSKKGTTTQKPAPTPAPAPASTPAPAPKGSDDPHYVRMVKVDPELGGIVQGYMTEHKIKPERMREVLLKLWRQSGGMETKKKPTDGIKAKYLKALKTELRVDNAPEAILGEGEDENLPF